MYQKRFLYKLLYILVFLRLVFCADMTAQDMIQIKGKISEGTSSEPMSFCLVQVKSTPIGVTANDSGKFELNISKKLIPDTLIISYIGYETLNIPISQLNQSGINLIKLHVHSNLLKEVLIRPEMTAAQVMDQVYKNLITNNANDVFELGGFFRCYLQLGTAHDKLIEGDVSIASSGFNAKNNIWDAHKIYLNEVRASFNSGEIKDGNKTNNLSEIISIHEHLITYFQNKKMYNFESSIEKIEYRDTVQIIGLKFYTRNEKNTGETTVHMKVNSSTWGIEEINFDWHIDKKEDVQIFQSAIDSIKGRNLSDNFTILYHNFKGKYYLQFFKRAFRNEIITPTRTNILTINTEYATNNILLSSGYHQSSTLLNRKESLYKQVCKRHYNPEFWKNYNLLLETPEMEVIKKEMNLKTNLDDQFINGNKYPSGNKKGQK